MLNFRLRRLSLTELYREGLSALEQERYRKAIATAAEAKRRHNTMSYELEARARWRMGQKKEALAILWSATRRYPTVAILWEYLGEYLSDIGQYDEATAAFMRAGEAGSSPCLLDYNLAVIAHRRGRLDEAVNYYRTSLADFDPKRDNAFAPSLLHAEAFCALVTLDRIDEARYHQKQIIEEDLTEDVRTRYQTACATLRSE